ncbi:hypothetical protein BH10BAC6_BH10BAC6_08250 [soil metagenome]
MRAGVENSIGVVDVIVTPEMTAQLDGREIHPVYSTFWLAYHAEVAARRAIEPFFEDDENAVGAELHIKHLAMTAIGATVQITARVASVRGPVITCAIEARVGNKNTLVAEGIQVQVCVADALLLERVAGALH